MGNFAGKEEDPDGEISSARGFADSMTEPGVPGGFDFQRAQV